MDPSSFTGPVDRTVTERSVDQRGRHDDAEQAADDALAMAVVQEMRRTRAIVPPTLRDAFTLRYVLALIAIAALTVASAVAGAQVISAQASSTAVVNVAGRQRMLSQRIALEANLIAQASSERRPDLRLSLADDVELMRSSQEALTTGDDDLGLPGDPSAEIVRLAADGLTERLDEYLDLASVAADPASTDAEIRTAAAALGLRSDELLRRLDEVVAQYQAESQSRISRIADTELVVLVVTLLVLAAEAAFVFRPMSRRIRRESDRLLAAAARHAAESERHSFGLLLRDAVDLTDSEEDLVDVIHRAVETSSIDGVSEVLLVDADDPTRLASSDATLSHACSVSAVDGCPALRRGRTLSLADPDGLGGCRHFRRDRAAADGPASTTCLPMTFMGTSIGVLRTVGEVGILPTAHGLDALETISRTAGTHVGTLRAFERSRADAECDPLTGLLNRRGLDEAVARLGRSSTSYVVVALDLDHFKAVNDTYGHEIGDRVLVEAGEIMRTVTRPTDIVARHGGEEFLIVAPLHGDGSKDGNELAAGVTLAERVRSAFERRVVDDDRPACTGSFGVAGPFTNDLDTGIRLADAAMYRAKELGRNRVEVDGDVVVEVPDRIDVLTSPVAD